MNEMIRARIMQILSSHRGRENSIPRKELAEKLERRFAIFIEDRKLRAIYATLPVCSCNEGIFIPRTPGEIQKYREYLRPHMAPEKVQARITILLTTWPHLVSDPGVQLEMFDGARTEGRP